MQFEAVAITGVNPVTIQGDGHVYSPPVFLP